MMMASLKSWHCHTWPVLPSGRVHSLVSLLIPACVRVTLTACAHSAHTSRSEPLALQRPSGKAAFGAGATGVARAVGSVPSADTCLHVPLCEAGHWSPRQERVRAAHGAPAQRPGPHRLSIGPRTGTGGALTPASSPHPSGPSREECIHCAPNFLFQDWRCVPACSEGFFPEDTPGLPHRVCRRYAPRRPPSAPSAAAPSLGDGCHIPPLRRAPWAGRGPLTEEGTPAVRARQGLASWWLSSFGSL